MNDSSVIGVARGVGERLNLGIRPLGHWMYCRKCRHSERIDVADGVYLVRPERSCECTSWAEVLALGPGCGKARFGWDAQMSKLSDMRKRIENPLRVGDLILCPDDHPWGIRVSPLSEWEYFIDECVPYAYVRPE